VHVENLQPIEEVGAEPPGGHLGRQIAVRRGNQADIRLERRCSAKPLEFPLLQHTEQLDLHRSGEFANLVKEQRSVRRQFEASGLLSVRPRKGTAFVAEQFRLPGECRAARRSSPR
jgi:hypothetical protein